MLGEKRSGQSALLWYRCEPSVPHLFQKALEANEMMHYEQRRTGGARVVESVNGLARSELTSTPRPASGKLRSLHHGEPSRGIYGVLGWLSRLEPTDKLLGAPD